MRWLLIVVISLLYLVGCGDPEPPIIETDNVVTMLVERTASRDSFKEALSGLNGAFMLENYEPLDSNANLPEPNPCSFNLATIDIGSVDEATAVAALKTLNTEFEIDEATIEPRGSLFVGQVKAVGDKRRGTDTDMPPPTLGVANQTGEGVMISVLDTGFAKDNVAFSSWSNHITLVSPVNFTSEDRTDIYDRYKDHEGLDYSYEGHGTPIALVAAAHHSDFKGVAPDAKVMPIKVCDDDGTCPTDQIIQGVCYALSNAPDNDPRKLVINLSLGGKQRSKGLHRVLSYALGAGASVVVSGGNNGAGPNDPPNYPAGYGDPEDGDYLEGLIVVGALEKVSGENKYRPASFSNRGPYIDVATLGVDVPSGQANPGSFGERFTGTSFAAAQISGAVARLKSKPENASDSVVNIEMELKASAKLNECTGGCTEDAVGAGILEFVDEPPTIVSFDATPTPVINGNAVTFKWELEDKDFAEVLECVLKPDIMGAIEIRLSECENQTFSHTYDAYGSYTAELTVRDSSNSETVSPTTVEVIPWTRHLATTETDFPRSIATDEDGNIYMAGEFYGSLEIDDYKVTGPFLAKYRADGTLMWIKPRRHSTGLFFELFSVDAEGSTYVVGRDPDKLFIVLYDNDGDEVWTKEFPSDNTVFPTSMTVDDFGNVYIAGTSVDLQSAFIMRYDSANEQFWLERLENRIASDERDQFGYLTKVATDSVGNIFMVGVTKGIFANTKYGSSDNFVVKFTSSGEEVWRRQYGSDADEAVSGLAVDSIGDIYITGYTTGVLQEGMESDGNNDVFLTKLKTTHGGSVWTKQIESDSKTDDIAAGITMSNNDEIFVVGTTSGELVAGEYKGGKDLFLSKYNKGGSQECLEPFGSVEDDFAKGITIDANGNVYVSATMKGVFDGKENKGEKDIVTVKFDNDCTKK